MKRRDTFGPLVAYDTFQQLPLALGRVVSILKSPAE